jgi:cob(I)alamin adenosyltransferase
MSSRNTRTGNHRPPGHSGDDRKSDLLAGNRRLKDDPAFQCLGWLDELNSSIGHLRAELRREDGSAQVAGAANAGPQSLDADLRQIQQKLSDLMGEVAGHRQAEAAIAESDVIRLEQLESELKSGTRVKPGFHTPGDSTVAGAIADVARARCRTAERALVTFQSRERIAADRSGAGTPASYRFVNRLSDYLFMVARFLDQEEHPS